MVTGPGREVLGNQKNVDIKDRWKVQQNRFRMSTLKEIAHSLFYLGLLVPDSDNVGEMAFRLGTIRSLKDLKKYAKSQGRVLARRLMEALDAHDGEENLEI